MSTGNPPAARLPGPAKTATRRTPRWRAQRSLLSDRLDLLRLSAAERGVSALLILVHLWTAAVPALTAMATGWLVAGLTGAATGSGSASAVAGPLVAISVLLVADEVLTSVGRTLEQYTAGRVDARMRRRVRRLAMAPSSMAHLEDPVFADDAARASDVGEGRVRSPGTAAVGQLRLCFRFLGALGSAAVIAVSFSVWLAAALLLVCLVNRALIRRWWVHLAEVRDEREGMRRRAEYWSDVASTGPAAKEIRLFGLHEWVVRRRTREVLDWAQTIWSARRGILRQQGWIALLAAVAAGSALLLPGLAAARGTLPVSDLMAVIVAAWGVFQIASMGREAFDIEYGLGAVRAMERLNTAHRENTASNVTDVPPAEPAVAGAAGPATLSAEGLVFAYPGSRHPVIDGLDLTVRPGEVLALVGHNGVGKTTLIKLIAGLYRPTDGRLRVDGRPLDEAGASAWRKRVAVVFQDFNRYPLSLADNIALSAPEHRHDEEGIRAAARRAGVDSLAAQWPHGYDTVLSADRERGTDLSGGQWQRVAIARAVFAVEHGRDLLVLDEPTAHLDVQAEARFHRQVVAEVGGATVVLISHRLSTVRQADRIALLEAGRVTEQGTHRQLLDAGGEYARLFALQAARFTDTRRRTGGPTDHRADHPTERRADQPTEHRSGHRSGRKGAPR
ncbi:ABC transporter ATP-binding protein/permease [Streptomyces sp. XM4193]|uniref:ABC transporter ATP-binding protein n=1 Tax=Streptomyces sp. XM4193 TaxID=2929782 RepID=UPI001FFB5CDF|nr:ABC transporter ATP-binding protein [Streptomyces sp. XM4193]MCK1798975.1 ABC transporter ATP-binding protein/permease [Streptomyces sp. XM4193]